MSIVNNTERRKVFFAFTGGSSATSTFIILILMLLAEGFAPISLTSMTAAFAQEGDNNTKANLATSNIITIPPSGIPLSPQPIYREQARTVSETPINQTHMSITFSGNGTLTMPNSTVTINTASNGSALISFMTQSAYGNEIIRTQESNGETATVTFHEIVQFDPITTGEMEGIVTAVIHTDSTRGTLAPLNGMILVGTDEMKPNGESLLTLWEWKSRVWNSDIGSMQESPMYTKNLDLRQ
jgi:hypothetical protein